MRRAEVHDLSPATRAVLALTTSGQPDSLTLVRGGHAFILSRPEVRKLATALERGELPFVGEPEEPRR